MLLSRTEREKKAAVLRVESEAIGAAREFLVREGFVELLPVIVAPLTDPLRHNTNRAVIEAYGSHWHLTRSMIFHKQAAVAVCDKVFSFSPNIRLEPPEWGKTGRHLWEFVQLDLEVRDGTRKELMELGERLLIHVLERVRERCSTELGFLGRNLPLPARPFPVFTYREVEERFGPDFEIRLSAEMETPFWIIDFPVDVREFYDREDPERPGILLDYDLIYPEGYGEALSGGEREYLPERIRERIARQGLDPAQYQGLLELAEDGLPPSAGFGIGVERLVRYICGLPHVAEARLFPRVPGKPSMI
ncbi:asparagine synthetase [Candidatus Acetothermia bacterium]|nr:MAG: asparagine synthetase [Candidatus Acetothermia bacterium]